MAGVKLTSKQQELIHTSVKTCGFKNYQIQANEGSLKGDNYLGVIAAITVKDIDDNRVLHLILKSAHTNENFRKSTPIAQFFHRETYLYDTIFPKLFDFQEEKLKGARHFTGVAKYYGSCLDESNESILMDNLKEQGYRLWDRKTPMNADHVEMVFSEYARFHALSMAFKYHHPEEFKELTKRIEKNPFETEESKPENTEMFFKLNFNSGLKGAQGSAKATAAIERLKQNISEKFERLKDVSDKNEEQVILHGDCWCNNILFKYSEDKVIPNGVCFIDWQLSSLGSPVLDLSYFFCVCSSKEVIHDLPKYLKIYHNVLSTNLKEMGCNPDEIFSFETFMDHWKKNSWYGIFMSMIILKIMLSDSSEAPDISSVGDEGKNIEQVLDFDVAKDSEYKQRLCTIVEYMADSDYI